MVKRDGGLRHLFNKSQIASNIHTKPLQLHRRHRSAWCLIWIGFIFTFSYAEVGLASSCFFYGESKLSCYCRDASNTAISASGYWRVGVSSATGKSMLVNDLDVGYCKNGNDILCAEKRPTRLENGTTLFLKNRASTFPNFFFCEIVFKQYMSAKTYTPSTKHLSLTVEGQVADEFLKHIAALEGDYPYMFLIDLTTLLEPKSTEATFLGWAPAFCGSAFKLTDNTTCTAIFKVPLLNRRSGIGLFVLVIVVSMSAWLFYSHWKKHEHI